MLIYVNKHGILEMPFRKISVLMGVSNRFQIFQFEHCQKIDVGNKKDISNNKTCEELTKNNTLLVRVIEVEDESKRSTSTKVIDVVAQEESCNDITIVATKINLPQKARQKVDLML